MKVRPLAPGALKLLECRGPGVVLRVRWAGSTASGFIGEHEKTQM